MKKRIISIFLLISTLVSCVMSLASCSDKELEAYTGELYYEILPIKNGANGIITIVHDDGNYDTVAYMKKQFERFEGLNASIAMVADKVVDAEGNEHKDAEKWKKIVKEGNFDIVCHTQSHTWYGFTDDGESGAWPHRDGYSVEYDYAPGHMTNEIVGAAERMREIFKDSDQKVLCYAIPGFAVADNKYSGRNDIAKEIIADNFIAARGSGGKAVYDGVEVKYMNDLDDINYYQLNSLSATTTADYETEWLGYVDAAAEYGGWGIFLFHSMIRVETDYELNVARSKTDALFRHLNNKVKSNEIWCATLTDAVQYTKEYRSATASVSVSGKGISVTVTDELNDYDYDEGLTVKVQVMDSWTSAKVKHNGEKLTLPVHTASDGTKFVYVDVVPDRGAAVINKG